MATFFMFGNYTSEAIKSMSAKRTEQVVNEIKKLKGEVNAMHALLGQYDLVFCVKLPNLEAAMKASVNIAKMTGISFVTFPAIPVETFDQLTAKD